jgi:hypothetical protein
MIGVSIVPSSATCVDPVSFPNAVKDSTGDLSYIFRVWQYCRHASSDGITSMTVVWLTRAANIGDRVQRSGA